LLRLLLQRRNRLGFFEIGPRDRIDELQCLLNLLLIFGQLSPHLLSERIFLLLQPGLHLPHPILHPPAVLFGLLEPKPQSLAQSLDPLIIMEDWEHTLFLDKFLPCVQLLLQPEMVDEQIRVSLLERLIVDEPQLGVA
jgi:hypothetical protein